MQEQVLEYFEEYFGGQLNESTTSEDIMDAVYDLIDLTEAVLEAVGDVFAPSGNEPTKQGWAIKRGHTNPSVANTSHNIVKRMMKKQAEGDRARAKKLSTKKKSTESPDPKWDINGMPINIQAMGSHTMGSHTNTPTPRPSSR